MSGRYFRAGGRSMLSVSAFTLGTSGGGAWSPTDLGSKLWAWYDATDSGSVTQSGGTVSQWADKSGNARHAAQATSGSRPAYNATGWNASLPALVFDGTDDAMSFSGLTYSGATGLAAFLAVENPDGTFGQRTIMSGANPGDPAVYWFGASAIYFGSAGVGDYETASPGRGYHIVGVEASTNFTAMMVNGTRTTNTTNPSLGTLSTIGDYAGGNFMNGAIGEIVLVQGILTTGERDSLNTYLTDKW